ncbi:hypothetical protein LSH36_418g02079 [Paralvinella palmiformis]|uniref:Protein FAN n=1 Tax=Paralvinella palmiformis TaxID=53620 RepID=A0AAD9JD31_9ANNE|nr:hypothetical protein LSH36_418g02079 [Paralvinella palmiformis]
MRGNEGLTLSYNINLPCWTIIAKVKLPKSCHTSGAPALTRQQKGWLKVCSKSLVFDPKDYKHPLLKLAFRDIKVEPTEWTGSMLSKVSSEQHMIEVNCSQFVEMKEDNIIAPYVFKRMPAKLLFSLTYGTLDDCLPLMCQLNRASSLDIGDQTAMINAIVLAKQNKVEFDMSRLENLREKIICQYQGDQIAPLVTNPGRILLTSERLYFQPFNNICPTPVLKISLCDISRIIKRRFLLKHVGVEIYCRAGSSLQHLYLSLRSETARNDLVRQVMEQQCLILDDTDQENMMLKWQNGLISNYDYLSYLNSLADRSINDLTQYPVFPWVLSDYNSKTLDLSNPEVYRDLSRPVGALNRERLLKLLCRYNEMAEPRFLYGSHYSTPGYVLFYLARIAPEYVLCLQNGRFDQPDRMFNSIAETWRNCLNSMSDFKELIPEFYDSDGEFLVNRDLLNFGMRQNGKIVGDVELPPWASGPKDFIAKMKEALESDHVSQNLHHWIDLVFGYKQRDEEAENSYNVFYHLTYEGYIDIESIEDLNERAALETQIMEFGQTPKQLFTKPHKPRYVDVQIKQLSNDVAPLRVGDISMTYPMCSNGHGDDQSSFWCQLPDASLTSSINHNLHKETLTDVRWDSNTKTVLSTAKDGMLKVFSQDDQKQLHSANISAMGLSSCVLMADDNTVILGSWDNQIYFYSLCYGKIIKTLYAHDDVVSSLWHCPNNPNVLLSSSWDSTVKIWRCTKSTDPGTEVDLLEELEHEVGVMCVTSADNGVHIAAGTKNGELIIWDVATKNMLLRQQDGRDLVSCGDDDSCLQVVDVRTGSEIFTKTCSSSAKCLMWDGRTILTGHSSGEMLVWDLRQVRIRRSFQGHTDAVTCMTISGDGCLASGGADKRLRIWKPVL